MLSAKFPRIQRIFDRFIKSHIVALVIGFLRCSVANPDNNGRDIAIHIGLLKKRTRVAHYLPRPASPANQPRRMFGFVNRDIQGSAQFPPTSSRSPGWRIDHPVKGSEVFLPTQKAGRADRSRGYDSER